MTQADIMRQDGYVPAADVMEALGYAQIGSVHRLVKSGKLIGVQAGKRWYIDMGSLLNHVANAPTLLERVRKLGVVTIERKKGASRARRTA